MALDEAGIQEQMRRNSARNYPRLAALGLLGNKVPVITCSWCGHMESCVFWTVEKDTGDTLHLRCPACEVGGVRYNLTRNIVSEPMTRNRSLIAAGLLLLLAAGVGVVSTSQSKGKLDGLRAWADEQSYEVVRAVLGDGGEVIYLASGDRKSEVERHVKATVPGDKAASLLHTVSYLPELNQTRLVLRNNSPAWRNWLTACGWEPARSNPSVPESAAKRSQQRCAGSTVARRE